MSGSPVEIPTLPTGTSFPTYYTTIAPVQNAAGTNTDDIVANSGLVTVSGTVDTALSPDGTTLAAYLLPLYSTGPAAYSTANGPSASSLVVTSDTDLHQTDNAGHELYSWSTTIDTTGLSTGLYALKTFLTVQGINQANGVTTQVTGLEDDEGTVTVQEFAPFTYVVHEDTEVVSVLPAAQTGTTIAVPYHAGETPTNYYAGETLTNDGRTLVWTSGDQYAENLQTGAITDLTAIGAPVPGTLATVHTPNTTLNPNTSNQYYPSFTAGGLVFGATSDFDFDPNNGAENPLPTVTDANGNTSVLAGFGTTPTYAGYATAASANGQVVLSIDPTGILYLPYGYGNGTATDQQAHVTFLGAAPTLAVDTARTYGEDVFFANGDGTEILTGTSNAIGQQVEVDVGQPGSASGYATVRADGTWTATIQQVPLNGTVYVSVTGADGTPTLIAATPYATVVAPAAPVLTVPTGPVDTAQFTVTGTAGQGDTVNLYDQSGNLLGTTLAYGYQGQVGPSSFAITVTTPVSEGSHTVYAEALEPYGYGEAPPNYSAHSTPITVVVDLTPPAATVTSLNIGTNEVVTLAQEAQPTITVTGLLSSVPAAGESVIVMDANGVNTTATLAPNGLSFTATVATPGASGTLTATVQDAAGNQSTLYSQAYTAQAVNTLTQLGSGAGELPSLSDNGAIVAYDVPATFAFPQTTPSHVFVTNVVTGVTVDAAGGLSSTSSASLSADGSRLVLEGSSSTGLSFGNQVYAVTVATDTATLLSFASGGTATVGSTGYASNGRIAAGGHWASFDSAGTDLGAGASGVRQVFEVNLDTDARRIVSAAATGVGNADSFGATMSADGSTVVFVSDASNLAGGSALSALPSGTPELYAATFDSNGNETIRLLSVNGLGAAADNGVQMAIVSANGRYAAFTSAATNLGTAGPADLAETYRIDLQTGAIILISATAAGLTADAQTTLTGISDDGNEVAFVTSSDNLGGFSGDYPPSTAYVKNVATGVLSITSSPGLQPSGITVGNATLSGDGRTTAYDAFGALNGGPTPTYGRTITLSTPVATASPPAAPTLTITGPAGAVGASITAEATGPAGAAVSFAATANDPVGGTDPVILSLASGSVFSLGTTTVTATATDLAGESATTSFTVHVVDTTAPTLTGPGALVVQATSAAGATVSFTGTAHDLVDGTDAVTFSKASGSVFALGTTTVTESAADAAGNTASRTFTVKVVDTIAPTLSVPAAIAVQATSPAGAVVTFSGGATDAVDGTDPVTFSTPSGTTFAVGTTTVTETATDHAGNTASSSFTVTVAPQPKPVLTLPAPIVVQATGPGGAVVSFTANAADPSGGTDPVVLSKPSGSIFALGTTTVTATATDQAGIAATGSFTVRVVDTAAPSLSVPAAISVQATSPAGAVVTFSGSATDAVDGTDPVTFSTPSGSTFAIGTTMVTETATDAAGNTASGNFTVTVSALQGKAADGYIAGATVFADANGNGQLDPGEASTTTDANGNFTLAGGSGPIVLVGGTDTSTGLAIKGTLTAPAGSTAVTPLTTLVQTVAATQHLTTAQAQAQVVSALGLQSGTSLVTTDPVAAANSGQAGGAALLAAGATVQDTVTLLQAAGATNVFAALAGQIAAVPTGSIYNTGSSATLTTLATASGLSGTAASTAAQVAAASNTLVSQQVSSSMSAAAIVSAIAASATVAQGSAAQALTAAGGNATTLAAVLSSYTGTNLANQVAAVTPAAPSTPDPITLVLNGVATTLAAGSTITTPAGTNRVDFGSSGGSVRTGGTDTVQGGAAATSVILGSSATVVGGAGALTVTGGPGTATVFAGSGGLTYTGGAGYDTVVGGGNSAVITGGTGGGQYFGGGNATITAGAGGTSIILGGNGDSMNAVGPGTVLFGISGGDASFSSAGSTGTSVFFGQAGTGTMSFITGSGTDLIALGQGTNAVTLGAGTEVVFGNTGTTATSTVTAGSGTEEIAFGGKSMALTIAAVTSGQRNLYLFNFVPGADQLHLTGFTAPQTATALAAQTAVGPGTTMALADGTTLWFMNNSHVSSGFFS